MFLGRTMPRLRSVFQSGDQVLSENSVVGPRASVFSPSKDGEAGDIGFIVDAAGCRQAENKPLEARSSFQTEPSYETRGTSGAFFIPPGSSIPTGRSDSLKLAMISTAAWGSSTTVKTSRSSGEM